MTKCALTFLNKNCLHFYCAHKQKLPIEFAFMLNISSTPSADRENK